MPVLPAALFCLMLFVNSVSADEVLKSRLSSLLPFDARWALVVVELRTGREIVATGSALKELLAPASLVKLYTAGALLDYAERHGKPALPTLLLHDGNVAEGVLHGNLYLAGRGNALLTEADLSLAAQQLRQQGIRQITGLIIADASYFDPRGLERTRAGTGYAPAGALGLDLHTVDLIVTPAEPGQAPVVSISPAADCVRLAVAARTVAGPGSGLEVSRLDDDAYRVTGNIAPDAVPVKQRFPLRDPARYAAGVFRTVLARTGVECGAGTGSGAAPAGSKQMLTIAGPGLDELVGEMNRHSINLVADNFLLLLGAARFGAPGTREKGLLVVRAFLDSLGLTGDETILADGSGLSGGNRTTARAMTQYLAAIAGKPWFSRFRESLPRPGLEGTLKNFPYRNERFFVKTGRLETSYSLAGYGVDGAGKEFAFAVFVDDPMLRHRSLEASGVELLRYLGTEVLR